MKKLYNFRLLPGLVDKVRKLAYQQSRSLTGQIEYILNEFINNLKN